MALLKKAGALLCAALAAALLLGGCSGGQGAVTETDVITVDGMYIDESFVDEENAELRRVYLFYTLHPEEENLQVSSAYTTELTINDTNTYMSEIYPYACDWMGSYYYSSTVEDVTLGSELKVATVFEIPEADLEEGRSITLSNSDIPSIEEIKLSTDDIVRCESAEAIAQEADPDGYAAEQQRREPADAATTERVNNAVANYEFYEYYGSLSWRTQFMPPDRFVTYANGTEVTGSYVVTNGYFKLTNDSNGAVVWIPYSWNDNGGISVSLSDGYLPE